MSLAAVAAAAALAGGQPPPEPVEPTATHPIVVDGKPMSRGHLRHWLEIARHSVPDAPRRQLRAQVSGLLISSRWIRLEAEELGVEVNRGAVTRAFRRQRRESFPRRRDYRKFLRDSGQTGRDIRFRIHLDLLSERIRRQVTEGAATPREEQQRLDEFVVAFRRKWRARTVCRMPWVTPDCGQRVSRSR